MEKRIKIGILDHSGEIGGAETSILTLLKHYDTSRFHIKMVLATRGGFSKVLKEMGIETLSVLLPSSLRNLKRGQFLRSLLFFFVYFFTFKIYLLKLRNLIKREGFDLLMTNTIKAHLYGSLASLGLKIPLIWRFHDILSETDFNPFYIKFIILLGNLLPQQILVVSEAVRESLLNYGLHPQKIIVIYNGVDTENLIKEKEEKALNIEKEKRGRIIGCFGRIVPQKGHKVLLSSIPLVVSSFPKTTFLIAGGVPENYQSYRQNLIEFIDQKGLKEQVFFMDFWIDPSSFYPRIDLLVFPSITTEAFGLVLLEAMALGKPVIASKVGGIQELIIDGINGILVEPNDYEKLAEKIKYLLENPEICKRIGEEAKRMVKEKFPLKNYIEAMEESFLKAFNTKGEVF